MSAPNPWHESFDALCEEMSEHWEGITQNRVHGRDETFYDAIFFAEIRGIGVEVDVSENATPTDSELADSGGDAEFIRISIHTSSPTMFALSPGPTDSPRSYREHTADPLADHLVALDAFQAIVRRLEPFALLRIEPWGYFLGRRIRGEGDLSLASVREAVEAMVDLVVLSREQAGGAPPGLLARPGRA